MKEREKQGPGKGGTTHEQSQETPRTTEQQAWGPGVLLQGEADRVPVSREGNRAHTVREKELRLFMGKCAESSKEVTILEETERPPGKE